MNPLRVDGRSSGPAAYWSLVALRRTEVQLSTLRSVRRPQRALCPQIQGFAWQRNAPLPGFVTARKGRAIPQPGLYLGWSRETPFRAKKFLRDVDPARARSSYEHGGRSASMDQRRNDHARYGSGEG